MNDHHQQAIEDLQVRISFQEDQIQELNLTVARQHNELQALRQAVQQLQRRLRELERNQPDAEGSASSFELPPHY